jgi:hypothetical protein
MRKTAIFAVLDTRNIFDTNTRNEQVGGSNPLVGSNDSNDLHQLLIIAFSLGWSEQLRSEGR